MRQHLLRALILTALLFVLTADVPAAGAPRQVFETTFRDSRDGTVYRTVPIGSREWLGANVKYVTSSDSWCYGDDASDCATHGRLYRWSMAREACPVGWRLPSDREWMELEEALGMSPVDSRATGARGGDQGLQLQAGVRSRMNLTPTGYRRPEGDYVRRGERAAFWTSTESNVEDAWHRDVRPGVGTIYRSPVTKTYALSVRCMR
jgi:uncharacterized protein (TIGR02145 family)